MEEHLPPPITKLPSEWSSTIALQWFFRDALK